MLTNSYPHPEQTEEVYIIIMFLLRSHITFTYYSIQIAELSLSFQGKPFKIKQRN